MKDKKTTRKNIIILTIIIIAGSITLCFLYPFIQLSLFYILTPKSEFQVKVEKYIEKYNRNCDADEKVKIINYYEAGPAKHCKFEFYDGRSHNDNSVISFFLELHNDFGYDFLCNDEIERDYFTEHGFQDFTLDNIRLSYGGTIPIGLDPSNIDATLYSLGKTIDVDQETISKFKGIVYVYSLEDVINE